MKQIAMKNSLF